MMGYGQESDDRADTSSKDIDVDSGDLSVWDYLTENFDDVGFLQDSTCTEAQFGANKYIKNDSNMFLRQSFSCPRMIQASNTRIEYSRKDFGRQLREDIVQGGGQYSQETCITSIGSVFQESNALLPEKNSSMTSANNTEKNCFREIGANRMESRHDPHQLHVYTPGFSRTDRSMNRSFEMVELVSNPLGLLNQSSVHGDNKAIASRKISSNHAIDYAPPLPQHKLLKPLTAYHYFYRVERDNIVEGMTISGDQIPDSVHDFSETKLRELLDRRWNVDPNKKRRAHRKTLGNLGFENFSRIITERWQKLSREGRQFYRRVAENDKVQYERYLHFSNKANQTPFADFI